MPRSRSTSSSDEAQARGGPEPSARVQSLRSGRFRVVVCLGAHPITGRVIRLSRTFQTEHEALTFRDAIMEQTSTLVSRLRRELRVEALPPAPGYSQRRTYLVRGQRVMLDADVAALFGTRTSWLNQAVSRNQQRFPDDFAFRLNSDEVACLRSLGVIRPLGQGGRRGPPRVFTESGLLMVGAILKSPKAVRLNIEVVRTVCDAGLTPIPTASASEA